MPRSTRFRFTSGFRFDAQLLPSSATLAPPAAADPVALALRVALEPVVELVAAEDEPSFVLVVRDGAARGQLVQALARPLQVGGRTLDAEPGRALGAVVAVALPLQLDHAARDQLDQLVEHALERRRAAHAASSAPTPGKRSGSAPQACQPSRRSRANSSSFEPGQVASTSS